MLAAFERVKAAIVTANLTAAGEEKVDTDALFGLRWKDDNEVLRVENESLKDRLEHLERQQPKATASSRYLSLSEVDQVLYIS